MKIFSINKTSLSKKISSYFQSEDVDNQLTIQKFADGEFCPIFTKSIRNDDVYLISDGSSSEDIIKLLLTIDASKRSGAKTVSVIIPYLPYSRSDKNDHIRQSISAKLIADILQTVGIYQIITVELHNGSIQGFYNVPVIHLLGNRIFIDELKSLNLSDICFVSPDHGATKRTLSMAKYFEDSSFAVIDKKRTKPNEVASMSLINSVDGKNVIIIDDLGDTMNTLCKASDLLLENGAKSVRAVITHGVLSGNSLDNIKNSSIEEIFISDTIADVYSKRKIYNQIEGKKTKINIISCSDLIVNSLEKIINNESINELNF